MITLYGDESHDDHTYALGGWLVTPTHYDILETEWRTMLGTIAMPDGLPCGAAKRRGGGVTASGE